MSGGGLKAAAAQVLALGAKLDEENTVKINYELLVLKQSALMFQISPLCSLLVRNHQVFFVLVF